MEKLFISGPFTGLAAQIRSIMRVVFSQYRFEVLEKNGNVPNSVASLIDECDFVIFILGSHTSTVEDVWGRRLVDLELSYIRQQNKPLIPVLIDIDERENVPLNVKLLRDEILRKFKDNYIRISEIIDYLDHGKLEKFRNKSDQITTEIARKTEAICTLGWKSFARVFTNSKVFISHSSIDKPFAERVYGSLLRHELQPWLDKYKIYAGRELARQIERAIDASGHVIVLLSENSIKSDWVKKEVRQALENEKKYAEMEGTNIIPVFIDNCEIPKTLSFLKKKLYVEMSNDSVSYERGISKIISAILDYSKIDPYIEG